MRKTDLKKSQTNEGLGDLAAAAEMDHEVQMARAELYKIAKYAIQLHDMLKGISEQEGLEGWVQAKITKAGEMLDSVYHHLDYEKNFEEKNAPTLEGADYKHSLKLRLEERAKSQNQQQLMGMAYAYKTGNFDGTPSEEVKNLAKSMTKAELKDFASTKHDGLPEKVGDK